MSDADDTFTLKADEKRCVRCGEVASVLHSISPSIVRDSCGRCQGRANREGMALVDSALAAVKSGRANANDLATLASNGLASVANDYIARHGYPGRGAAKDPRPGDGGDDR